jgi:hypothetical protein
VYSLYLELLKNWGHQNRLPGTNLISIFLIK